MMSLSFVKVWEREKEERSRGGGEAGKSCREHGQDQKDLRDWLSRERCLGCWLTMGWMGKEKHKASPFTKPQSF